jgi:hypothetical protein
MIAGYFQGESVEGVAVFFHGSSLSRPSLEMRIVGGRRNNVPWQRVKRPGEV